VKEIVLNLRLSKTEDDGMLAECNNRAGVITATDIELRCEDLEREKELFEE
jgi:hypothetical protein